MIVLLSFLSTPSISITNWVKSEAHFNHELSNTRMSLCEGFGNLSGCLCHVDHQLEWTSLPTDPGLPSVTTAIKDCWLDQSEEYVDKSDPVEFFFFFQNTVYQNEVIIIAFDIYPFKYYFCLGKYVALIGWCVFFHCVWLTYMLMYANLSTCRATSM